MPKSCGIWAQQCERAPQAVQGWTTMKGSRMTGCQSCSNPVLIALPTSKSWLRGMYQHHSVGTHFVRPATAHASMARCAPDAGVLSGGLNMTAQR